MTLPASDAQRTRLADLAARGPVGVLRHCLTAAIDIRGPVDPDAVRAGLARVIARRPALRSRFDETGNHAPVAAAEPVFEHRTMFGRTVDERLAAAHEDAAEEGHRPLPPGSVPLLRGLLLSAARDRHLLVVTADQLACDAWSLNMILDDLIAPGETAEHPDAYEQVWSARQAWLDGAEGKVATERCRTRLVGASRRWPVPVAPGAPGVAVRVAVDLDDDVALALRERTRRARSSMLAVGAAALSALAPEDAGVLAFTSTLAARETLAEQTVVGWFANEAVVRVSPRTGTVRDQLTALRGEVFAALRDQRVPLERVENALEESGAGLSLALLYLPGQLSGGDQGDLRVGAARATRSAVSICPTRADVDLFLVEDPPPMADGARPLIRIGATAHGAVAEQDLRRIVQDWHAALIALAGDDWDAG